MTGESSAYEIGYKKPPIETRFKKGVCPNPTGRRGKKGGKKAPHLDPGKALQSIDNEQLIITIDGKRKAMRKAEVYFRQLFGKALKGDLTTARLIAKMAANYFGPQAEGAGEARFIVAPSKRADRNPTDEQQVAAGVLFRKVARDQVQVDAGGAKTKMTYWDAYIRQIYTMALNKNTSAARLLEHLRRQFPGDALPGDPIYFIIYEEDAKL